MRRISFTRVVFVLCLAMLSSAVARSQSMPRSGQHFAFGVIEGAERLAGSQQATALTLTVVSAYSGTGVIRSPCGFSSSFSFSPTTATIISLPDSLIHLNDLGATKKGILVETTEPVNLVLHDFLPEAGDATQIYPIEALDTSYVASEWGIWNDPSDNENNRAEILVVAAYDETVVTITPSVQTLLGQAAGVPFRLIMNKGDCYMVKADISAEPAVYSLTGSTVRSTAPVAVIVGTTCAYVPLAVQSCNELMDQLSGIRWWGSHFFLQPLGNEDSVVELVAVSDREFSLTVTPANGNNPLVLVSSGKRMDANFSGPIEVVSDVPVQIHQLTRASSLSFTGVSDPTLVTVLPVSQYADTLLWNSPHLDDGGGVLLQHWAPIIYPTAQASAIRLDGVPLPSIPNSQLWGPVRAIGTSGMSAMNPTVAEGMHRITSPVPVFALATGFASADAYSFIPGTVSASVLQRVDESSIEEGQRMPSTHITISAHPNPTSDRLWVIGDEAISRVRIVDPLGRIVRNTEPHAREVAFSVSDLASGTYFLLVETAGGAEQQLQIAVAR